MNYKIEKESIAWHAFLKINKIWDIELPKP